MKFPVVAGKITFEGLSSTKFWVRVFGLEEHVAFVQAKINEKPERRTAAVPIINDYEVDPERLRFYYAMQLKVDALGVQGGIGVVFFSDKEHASDSIARRDQLADQMVQNLKEREFGEQLEGYVVKSGKET